MAASEFRKPTKSGPVFVPREYQKPIWDFLDDGGKRAMLCWHRRAGKDLTMLNYTIRAAQKRVGIYFYFLPFYSQAKKIVWDGMTATGKKFLDYFPKNFVDSTNETELQVTLKNGSIIQLIGTDNFDSVVGTNPVGCVFSEFSLQNPKAWDLVRPILSENKGWAVFVSTPRGRNHFYKLFEMAKKNNDWFTQLLTVSDTKREDGSPVISEGDVDRERAEGMDEALVQQEFYCDFSGVVEGSYYTKALQQLERSGQITNVPWEPNLPVDTYWDLGMADATAIWFTQSFGKEIRIIDFYEATGEGLVFYSKLIKEKPYVYGRHNGPHDLRVRELGSGKSREEVAADLGIFFDIVPNIPIADGIDSVRNILPRCWFDKTKCADGLERLYQYHKEFDEKSKVFKDRPEHDWSSHAADGFRYLAVGYREHRDERARQTHAIIDFNVYDYNHEKRGHFGDPQTDGEEDWNPFG